MFQVMQIVFIASGQIIASTTQDSRDKETSQENNHEVVSHQRKSTASKSPTSPISAADDKCETDVTEYDEIDQEPLQAS